MTVTDLMRGVIHVMITDKDDGFKQPETKLDPTN